MRAVIQLVSHSSVTVEDSLISEIDCGLLVLLGVAKGDTENDVHYLVNKITNLRIFQDDNGQMNKSLLDVGGDMLVVSQFTLLADCRKGRRPSYNQAAPPQEANTLYELFLEEVKNLEVSVCGGKFQAMMQVKITNEGPVTIIIETPKKHNNCG